MGLLLATALLHPLLCSGLPAGGGGVRLELRPRAGAVVAVELDQTSRTRVSHEEGWPLVNGARLEGEGWVGDGAPGGTAFELALEWEDRCGAVAEDGRVLGLERRFGAMAGTSVRTDGEDQVVEEFDLGSPLAGRAVRFSWDDEAGRHRCAFVPRDGGGPFEPDEREAEAVLLEDQRLDAHGGWFLPPAGTGELEPGDGWELDVAAWNDFLTMGGDWWIGPADAPPPDRAQAEASRDYERQLREGAEGVVRCVLVGTREEEGRVWAEVSVEAALGTRAALDLTEEFEGTRTEVSVEVTTDVRAAGTLLWDLERGAPGSLEVRIELATRTREVSVAPHGDGQHEGTSGTELVTVEETVSELAVRFTHGDG